MDKDKDLERIFKNSEKAELIEAVSKELERGDSKVVVVIINDIEDTEDNGKYTSIVMTLGLEHTYEAYGILEVAKRDLLNDGY